MSGKQAKALRRKIYGDMSQRNREYEKGHAPVRNKYGRLAHNQPQIICSGLRRAYQDAKRLSR